MNDHQWNKVVNNIYDNFKVTEDTKRVEKGSNTTVHTIIFGPKTGLEMKLERIVKPRIIREMTKRSKRIGATAWTEKVFSKDEFVSIEKFYRWDNKWVEQDIQSLK